MQVSDLIQGSVTLAGGGIVTDTSTGAVHVYGLELKFDITLGPIGIKDLDVKYQEDPNTHVVTISASGMIEFPNFTRLVVRCPSPTAS